MSGDPRPDFPTDVLPDVLRNFVLEVATSTQTPPDMAAMMTLATLAVACQGKARVVVREGHAEQLSIFVAICMAPGERKTGVMQLVAAPAYQYELELQTAMMPTIQHAQDEYQVESMRLKNLMRSAARAEPEERSDIMQEVEDQRLLLGSMFVPAVPRLLTDDVTSQRFGCLLAENGGRMGILSGEPGLFESLSNNRIAVLLKGYSGDPLLVDRVTREGENVPSPAISLGLPVQPVLLRNLGRHNNTRGRGLLGRFIFCVPSSMVGHREVNPPVLSMNAVEAWGELVRSLLVLPVVTDGMKRALPRDIPLSSAATELLSRFSAEVERELAPGGDLVDFRDWGTKGVGHIVRIAGLLHLATLAERGVLPHKATGFAPIPVETMNAAIRLYPYLKAHMRRAFALMDFSCRQGDAQYLWERIVKNGKGKTPIPRQDVWQWARGELKPISRFNAAIAVLEERGFVRTTRNSGLPHRPGIIYSIDYSIDPEALDEG